MNPNPSWGEIGWVRFYGDDSGNNCVKVNSGSGNCLTKPEINFPREEIALSDLG
jgi:hypothetical protein